MTSRPSFRGSPRVVLPQGRIPVIPARGTLPHLDPLGAVVAPHGFGVPRPLGRRQPHRHARTRTEQPCHVRTEQPCHVRAGRGQDFLVVHHHEPPFFFFLWYPGMSFFFAFSCAGDLSCPGARTPRSSESSIFL